MTVIQYREASSADIPDLAKIRAQNWGSEEYWNNRIAGYLNGELHPKEALPPRVIYIATDASITVGFIGGHLTRRFGCNGELEWIDVIRSYQRTGIASELLRLLATWFIRHKSLCICVDVDPANTIGQNFYKRHGAENLNEHWLVWKDISEVIEQR